MDQNLQHGSAWTQKTYLALGQPRIMVGDFLFLGVLVHVPFLWGPAIHQAQQHPSTVFGLPYPEAGLNQSSFFGRNKLVLHTRDGCFFGPPRAFQFHLGAVERGHLTENCVTCLSRVFFFLHAQTTHKNRIVPRISRLISTLDVMRVQVKWTRG